MNIRYLISLSVIFTLLSLKPAFAQVKNDGEKMTPKEVKRLVDTLSNVLTTWYMDPEKAAVMVSTLKKNYSKGDYFKAKNRTELGERLLQDMVKIHGPGRFGFRYFREFTGELSAAQSDSVTKQNQEFQLNYSRENNYSFKKTEVLPGNIGYVRWDAFDFNIEEAQPTLTAAFQFVRNCKAVILDMRYNAGGSRSMVLHIQNYFFSQKTNMINMIDNLYDTLKRETDPSKTDFKLNMPLYILTSRQTISGAEDFTHSFQKTKRATLVGETTAGSAHPSKYFYLGQGFDTYLPINRPIASEEWEGVGIKPDVPVRWDQALAKAQVLIYTQVLPQPKDSLEKNSFQWTLNSLRADLSPAPDPSVLNSYAAVYEGGLEFHTKDGHLFCKNGERGNSLYELRYIDTNLFILDENVQVEFVKDAGGSYSKIKMRWKEGYISEKKKL